MILSRDTERVLDNIQHRFMIKTLSKIGTQIHSQHNMEWEKLESIYSQQGIKTRMATLTTFIQQSTESPSQIKQTREIKGIQIDKEEVKLSLFADDIITYLEDPKDYFKKLLELINEFSNISVYKINVHKSVALLQTNIDQAENQIKNWTPFTTAVIKKY